MSRNNGLHEVSERDGTAPTGRFVSAEEVARRRLERTLACGYFDQAVAADAVHDPIPVDGATLLAFPQPRRHEAGLPKGAFILGSHPRPSDD